MSHPPESAPLSPAPHGMRIVRNAVAGFGGRFATLTVGLLMAPYLLGSLGAEAFGLWALVSVITGSLGLLDFSVRVPLIKYLAEESRDDASAAASSGFAFSCAVALLAGAVFVRARTPMLDWLAVPADLRGDAAPAFALCVAGALLGIALSVYPAICDARQRMDVTNGLGVASLLAGAALTVVAIESGYGLVGVAAAQLIAIAIFHLTSVVAAARIAPSIRVRPRLVSRRWLWILAGFGFQVHAGRLCTVVSRELDKVLLARWSGLQATAAYEMGVKLVSSGASLVWFLSAALLPAVSRLSASRQGDVLALLHRHAFRYVCLVSIPMFAFVVSQAPRIIEVWVGRPLPFAAATVAVLSLGYVAAALTSGMIQVAQGVGRPGLQTEQAAVQLVVNVVSSVVLYRWLGPIGAPLGTSVALVLGAALLTVRLHAALRIPVWTFLRDGALAPLLCATAAVGATALSRWMQPEVAGRAALLPLLLDALIFSVTYAGLLVGSGVVVRQELRQLTLVLMPGRGARELGA